MKNRILSVFLFFIAIFTLNCSGIPNGYLPPNSLPSVAKNEFNLWDAISADLNVTSSGFIEEEMSAITHSAKYSYLLSSIEDLAGQQFRKTQCGRVDGIFEFLGNIIAHNDLAGRNDSFPGKVFILKFHSQENFDHALYAFVTIPGDAGAYPLTILSHEAPGGKLGYNHIVNRLNLIQTKSITAMNAYPGECLVNKAKEDVSCSTPVPNEELTYNSDVNANLALSDCMRKLSEQSTIDQLDSKLLTIETSIPNPFHNRIEKDINNNIKQILFGFSYGGGVSLLTAAKAGMLISQMNKGYFEPGEFFPHYFHAIGAVAPFGSMIVGETEKLAKTLLLTPRDGRDHYLIGFLTSSIGGTRNLTDPAYLEPFELNLARTDSVFYSKFLHLSLGSIDSSSNGNCQLAIFYCDQDEFVNYPSHNIILSKMLKSTCNSSTVSFYNFSNTTGDPHTLWKLRAIHHTINQVEYPESVNKSLYFLEKEWFDHL